MTKILEEALELCEKVRVHLGDLEDFGDRFNYMGCVAVLLVCTLVVSAKQYFFKPISCYIATEAGGANLLQYVENYCWVQGTVPITYEGRMPTNEDEWRELEERKILYYQWVPFVLGLQCILFCLPRLVWKLIYLQAGTHGNALNRMVLRACDALRAPPRERETLINEIADIAEYHFTRHNLVPKLSSTSTCGLYKPRPGIHLISSYLIVKLLYLINALGQLYMMHCFLGFNSYPTLAYGLSVFQDIVNGHDWQTTQIFPRVGFCYVELKFLGTASNSVTAQCALPLNMLNEKIFLLLWWWIAAAAVITASYLGLWIFRFSTQSRETNYIFKYIQLGAENFTHFDQQEVEHFARGYLKPEGIFLVRMVRLNAGEQVAAAVVRVFWERYKMGRVFPMSNLPTAPASNIVPQDLYPNYKSVSKSPSSSSTGNEDENNHKHQLITQAFV